MYALFKFDYKKSFFLGIHSAGKKLINKAEDEEEINEVADILSIIYDEMFTADSVLCPLFCQHYSYFVNIFFLFQGYYPVSPTCSNRAHRAQPEHTSQQNVENEIIEHGLHLSAPPRLFLK